MTIMTLCLASCDSEPQLTSFDSEPRSIELSYKETVERSGGYVAQNDVEVPWNDCHTPLQYAYLMSDYDQIDKFAFGNLALSDPKPIVLTFNNKEHKQLEISKYQDFSDSAIYDIAEDSSFYVYNLEVGSDYYYRPYQHDHPVVHFKTLDLAPRILKIDGTSNIRDIGGYVNSDGKRIKQGLFIRGAEWNIGNNESGECVWKVTEEGQKVIRQLGIKTEIDLRMEGEEACRTKDDKFLDINPILIPIDYNNASFYMDYRKDELRDVFNALTTTANYPVYLHCRIGTDRTGISSFLLECLLGMKKEDIYRDYLMSNFDKVSGSRKALTITRYFNYLEKNSEGDTIAEHAYNYLAELGIPKAQLDATRAMFLD